MNPAELRVILVPGGGGSGPDHWHHRWAAAIPRCEWVVQRDASDGERDEWLDTIDRQINHSSRPAVLVAHSLAAIACAHWAAERTGPVVGALMVAPVDVDIVAPNTIYSRFQPMPVQPLPFVSTVVASTDDAWIAEERAAEIADAWGSTLHVVGAHKHLGSDARLGEWPVGRQLLADLIATI